MVMKFYTQPGIPNPDVVHMFAEEIGCTAMLQKVPVNVRKAENRTPEFLKMNPLGEVPALELPNGTVLTESVAIAKYLSDVAGGSSVVGTTPEEKAETDMWTLRINDKIISPMMLAFQNGPMFDFFKDRRPGFIHKELAEPSRAAGKVGLAWLERQFADGRKFLCGERFSLADIRFYCLFNFFAKGDKSQALDPALTNIAAYLERVKTRPSAIAILPKPQAKL